MTATAPNPPGSERTRLACDVFLDEYIVDFNVSRAAKAAGIDRNTARLWLRSGPIDAALRARYAERAARCHIEADQVLLRVFEAATADADELVEVRRVNCRHCHGEGHAYQFLHNAERKRAEAAYNLDGRDLIEPFTHGGIGFKANRDPHPDCPECHGEGLAEVMIHDTRTLSPGARTLYAGAKVTKEGIEVKMSSRDKYLELLMRHLGLLNDNLNVTGDASIVERILAARKGTSST